MYNLFIAPYDYDWDCSFIELNKSRVLEYTTIKIYEAYRNLTNDNIKQLMSYPCLLGYENFTKDFYLAKIKSINNRDSKVYIEFEIDYKAERIPIKLLKSKSIPLDIRNWEINRTHWALKEVDLINKLTNDDQEKIKLKKIISPINTYSKKITTDKKVTNYKKTLNTIIKEILEIEENDSEVIFYRGHSNKNKYKLEPSLFRKDENGNYLYLENEDVMYRELLVSNANDFINDKTALENLIRMQHYSLPTRLLDITSNPLIALYFACKGDDSEKGEIIVFKVIKDKVKYFDSDTVSCISNLVKLTSDELKEIDFEDKNFNEQPIIKRLLHYIKEEKPFFEPEIYPDDLQDVICIKGKQNNSRIISQSGAFFLFGYDAILEENGNKNIKIERITISDKKRILNELNKVNINERTVFPYIENSAKFIAEKYKFSKK